MVTFSQLFLLPRSYKTPVGFGPINVFRILIIIINVLLSPTLSKNEQKIECSFPQEEGFEPLKFSVVL
jgi:hypothetical protein